MKCITHNETQNVSKIGFIVVGCQPGFAIPKIQESDNDLHMVPHIVAKPERIQGLEIATRLIKR